MHFDPKIVFRRLCVTSVTLIALFAVGTWYVIHNGDYSARSGIASLLTSAIVVSPIYSGSLAFYGARVHSKPNWLEITIMGVFAGLAISFGCFYLLAFIVVHYLI